MKNFLYVIVLGIVFNLLANMIWHDRPNASNYISEISSAILISICLLVIMANKQKWYKFTA